MIIFALENSNIIAIGMRKILLTLFGLILTLTAADAQVYTATQKLGFPILGGELSNSAATSVEDVDEVMPRMRALGLNTVLVPAYWELMEPVEGTFDFTLIDRTIDVARREQLHVVFLWFGVWKNSMSCYTPSWFKQDTKRFPRAMTAEGKQMEIASCFSDNVLQADLKAFSALMQHIRERDPQREVVVMMQIENEIGMLESARDHSPLAEKAYKQERWAERYGTDEYADEKFMALSYARYVEHLAKAARDIHDMPRQDRWHISSTSGMRGHRVSTCSLQTSTTRASSRGVRSMPCPCVRRMGAKSKTASLSQRAAAVRIAVSVPSMPSASIRHWASHPSPLTKPVQKKQHP